MVSSERIERRAALLRRAGGVGPRAVEAELHRDASQARRIAGRVAAAGCQCSTVSQSSNSPARAMNDLARAALLRRAAVEPHRPLDLAGLDLLGDRRWPPTPTRRRTGDARRRGRSRCPPRAACGTAPPPATVPAARRTRRGCRSPACPLPNVAVNAVGILATPRSTVNPAFSRCVGQRRGRLLLLVARLGPLPDLAGDFPGGVGVGIDGFGKLSLVGSGWVR